ncbi:hypothetical protein [Streptomyces sp. SID10815]|uniref:hypothetical protein n=1 Tax=Streptomyces sp. SID10815 TaxID=2706027 RepID=UPI0013C96442|nr:hypothetical protein [Streptomyces sp. SID10815]NEA52437.1 hypothetical protein [Streptomyces sp. SID10815]
MPILVASAGTVADVIPAAPGWRVDMYSPERVDGVPVASAVVAWASIADPDEPGGVRLDPVFLAGGRAWTPDQFRAAYGQQLDVRVAPAQ